jgi:glycosyltransferase involved in cell wall biosynthesis
VGYLSRESTELADCFCAADVFVFSSRTETQGLVLLEALALGVPVVSTAEMGTLDILRPSKGAIVVPEQVSHFAQQVLLVLQNDQLRAKLSQEGREYAKNWYAGPLADKMLDFYEQVIEAYRVNSPSLQGG